MPSSEEPRAGEDTMVEITSAPARARWARFRFGVIAPLLTAPPEPGELGASIATLAARSWPHPTTGEAVRLSAKTIERWFYIARDDPQPIEALARKVPSHAGTHPSISPAVEEEIRTLRRQHPRWSYQLVHDNLVAIGRQKPELGVLPGYATVCRYMKHHGLGKRKKLRRHEKGHRRKEAVTVVTIVIPDERILHHFPEAATLALLDAALAATETALRSEHPTVDELPFDPEHEIVPSLLTAHLILSRAVELRDLLRLYAAAVKRAVGDHAGSDDGLF